MKKILYTIIFIICFSSLLSAKPAFEIKLLNSFTLPDFAVYEKSGLLTATEDALIAVMMEDSLPNYYFCYDFKGNPINNIVIQTDSLSGAVNSISYLAESKELAFAIKNFTLGFFNLQGYKVAEKEPPYEFALNKKVYEYDGKQYYVYWNPAEAWNGEIVTRSMTLYVIDDYGMHPWAKKLFPTEKTKMMDPNQFRVGNFDYGFIVDNNLDKVMAFVDQQDKHYQVRFYSPEGNKIFSIKRKKNEMLGDVIAGENFICIFTFAKDSVPTSTTGIYDLNGEKVYSFKQLKQIIGKNIYIIDIVNDKFLIYKEKENQVYVYEVKLTANK